MKKLPLTLFFAIQFLCFPPCLTLLPGGAAAPQSTLKLRRSFTLDTLTVYNPLHRQCDADPLITASNRRINVARLKTGDLRWMAVSRDLLARWGGALHYGDTVEVVAGDHEIDGKWIIQDTMAKRFRNRGDLLFHHACRHTGRWTDVKLEKEEKYYLADAKGDPSPSF